MSALGNYAIQYHMYTLLNVANTCMLNTTMFNIDVNECAFENGGCQHDCVNTGGSYSCMCYEGYVLQNDRVSCE